MSVQLNHTIVLCRDQQRPAEFPTEVLGLPFLVVEADNGVSPDFGDTDATTRPSTSHS
jgi:hypothetical protein